ncbi:MAG: rSAM/selenodomain-associated transferase 1 [Halioglobus sp.]
MKHDSVLLIQFAKEPVPGLVKTRMQPQLSPSEACALHIELVLWTCSTLCQSHLGDVELWCSGSQQHPTFLACESMGLKQLCQQQGSDLGDRMHHAMREGLKRYAKVVLVGSDCPAIDHQYLAMAVDALDSADLVLGPANDGGYVLIGANRIHPGLFEGVVWGDAGVFQQTLERAGELDISSEILSPLSDIDIPEDLSHWQSLQKI